MQLVGADGFLGTRASWMLDVVVVAMVVVLPVLITSWWLVRYRRQYRLHKLIQLTLGMVLLVAITGFEIDIRLSGWEHRASPSVGIDPPQRVYTVLWIHLVFAVSTAVLWVFVTVQALRKIPNPPGPSAYSRRHIFWARLAAVDMVLTAVTGWWFYWVAFVA